MPKLTEKAWPSAVPEQLPPSLEEGVEPGIRARFDESLAIAKSLGAEIVDVELPYSRHGLAAYYVIAPAEASANLSRFDGVRYGLRVDGKDIRSMYEATRDAGFGAEVKRRVMIGTYALSAGYHDAYYVQAQRVRTLIRQDFDTAFAGVDAILLPTAPTTAFPIGALVLGVGARVYSSVTGATAINLGIDTGSSSAYGAGMGTSAGTVWLGLIGIQYYWSTTHLTINAASGTFTGGSVKVSIHYITLTPPV